MKVDIIFDATSQKPHVSFQPETPEEADQVRLLAAFQDVTFFFTVDEDEVCV